MKQCKQIQRTDWMRPSVARRTVAIATLALHLALTLTATRSAGATPIAQRIREVDVASLPGEIYAIEVVASPKLTTNIRFPEGFVVQDVLCGGACIDAVQLKEEGNLAAANWVIEKRAQQQSIHVWPARLPGPGNPPSAYTTNVYVATDDGRAYNITLKLLDLATAGREADAVVNIVNSSRPRGAARLMALQQTCRDQAREELTQEARTALYAGLNGPVTCKKVSWNKPHRNGMMVVRIDQLCRSDSDKPMIWARFTVENRGDAPLRIDEVLLDPASSSFGGQSEPASALAQSVVPAKKSVSGVAVRTFSSREHGLRGWQLQVTPEPNETSSAVQIDSIHF